MTAFNSGTGFSREEARVSNTHLAVSHPMHSRLKPVPLLAAVVPICCRPINPLPSLNRRQPFSAVAQVSPHCGAGGVGVLAADGGEDGFVLEVGQIRTVGET